MKHSHTTSKEGLEAGSRRCFSRSLVGGANKLAPANLVLPCPSSYAPKPKAALGEDNIFNNPLPALP